MKGVLRMLFARPSAKDTAVRDYQNELRSLRKMKDREAEEASRRFIDALYDGVVSDIRQPPIHR